MKVYVDDNDDYRITYSSRDGSECLESMGMQPIIVESLSDYTKQVKKQVCDEIRNKIKQAKLIYEWKSKEITIEEILNQIQGDGDDTRRSS